MKSLHKFDIKSVHKIAKILEKYDCKLPFGCIVELSYLIKEDNKK